VIVFPDAGGAGLRID